MQKRTLNLLGILLILIGAVLLLNSAGITGFAILENVDKTAGNILGLALAVGGVLLLQAGVEREGKERRLEKALRATQQELKSGRRGTVRDVRYFARKLDYDIIKPGGRHQEHIVDRQGNLIEPLAVHPGDMAIGTYRRILRSLIDNAAANY
jgi:uncharacterized membrane protein YccC